MPRGLLLWALIGLVGLVPRGALGQTAPPPFSAAADCARCHPRQFDEWRTSPHTYTGVSPTFWSLADAGQNSGAGLIINGTSVAGAVGNFCAPCHGPHAVFGQGGSLGGNNAGFGNVRPEFPFVCGNRLPEVVQCTAQTSLSDCGAAGQCSQFEGRACVNMPPVNDGETFPRQLRRCSDDADCRGLGIGCEGDDCGPCIISPSTIFFSSHAQEGITCETCHNMLPNVRRSCQLFRGSDSVGTFSYDLASRTTADGERLRLGPFPLSTTVDGLGRPNDELPLVDNDFHASARVDTPLMTRYDTTDRPNGTANPAASAEVVRQTELTCPELPYCSGGLCEGGSKLGATCATDTDCGGCGPVTNAPDLGRRCGGTADGAPCRTSTDCGRPSNPSLSLLARGTEDGTIGPLVSRQVNGERVLDRPDANFFRSSTMCATCHDVRPPQINMVLRSCQLQKTHVCDVNSDCVSLNIGCPGNDCGPCVAENNTALTLQSPTGAPGSFPVADPRNTGYRRVENLFTEWQISVYNHPELSFCQGNSFKACMPSADESADGPTVTDGVQALRAAAGLPNGCTPATCDSDHDGVVSLSDGVRMLRSAAGLSDCGVEGPCDVSSPFGRVVTCQNCHMSKFPEVPLIRADGSVTPENELYGEDLVAQEGSQSDRSEPLPLRRVSTHFMSGVDLPLLAFPGQSVQATRRQQLVDAAFKITLDQTPARAEAGGEGEVKVTIENVGVGHRVPAGFSHERQYWVQMFVQDAAALNGRDPFDPDAPCNLQHVVATGADDTRDPEGAAELAAAGCAYRSGFILDKAHPETGELAPDGSRDDEDPEDFFVVAGTRVRGTPTDPRIEVRPGAKGRALTIQNICAKATEEAYVAGIRDGTGLDMVATPGFPHQVRFCDPAMSPNGDPPRLGVTPSGFGNPACMENGEDLGPCVSEIELSDGNERGRCARNLSRAQCGSDAECGDDGPCLFRCARFSELECCDPTASDECRQYYDAAGVEGSCQLEPSVCVGGPESGVKPCTTAADCPGEGATCGDVGPCNIENRGIVNFQNAFRATTNGVCVDPMDPRDANLVPKPARDARGEPRSCLLNLSCQLAGLPPTASGRTPVCLVNGQCADGVNSGKPCTNYTYEQDCAGAACNVEANLELNGRASESVFIQNHPFNFNSLPPFQPRTFAYQFEVPEQFRGRQLVVAARIMNRHFPMRFLRNLVGTQVVKPPLIVEARGNPANPDQCRDQRTIDIDCFVRPLAILGNAERGGFVPATQRTRTTTVTVE
jgi:hypothetical protein